MLRAVLFALGIAYCQFFPILLHIDSSGCSSILLCLRVLCVIVCSVSEIDQQNRLLSYKLDAFIDFCDEG